MHLYIRARDIYMEIPNITLRQGCIPTVGDQNDGTEEHGMHRVRTTFDMEPAVWFKVLLLDSLSIDCQKRAVMWNCDSALSPVTEKTFTEELSKLARRKRISESMYVGGEFFGFDADLDELFNSVDNLVSQFAVNEIHTIEFHDKLLKLLHCHVLPAIKVSNEDLPRIEKVYTDLDMHIKHVEKDIVTTDKKLHEIMKSMERLRQRFVIEYAHDSEKEAKPCSVQFARTLQQDVELELQQSGEELGKLQDAVEKEKKRLAEKAPGVSDETVEEKRRTRDLRFEKHKDLLTTRETLYNITSRVQERKSSLGASIKKSLRHKKSEILNPLHSIYLELHNTLQTAQEEYQAVCDKKLLIISVKEAVRSTIEDLKAGQETVGIDMDKTGKQRATDVLTHTNLSKEWLTIAEKVANTLADESSPITLKHNKFCQKLVNQCKAALFEKQLLDIVSQNPGLYPQSLQRLKDKESSASLPSHFSKKYKPQRQKTYCSDSGYLSHVDLGDSQSLQEPRESQVSMADSESFTVESCVLPSPENSRDSIVQFEGQMDKQDVVLIHDFDKNNLKSTIDKLKQDILTHIEEITHAFQDDFKQYTHTSFKNIWLRYEAHFYDITMPYMVKLYETAYMQISERFSQSVNDLTASDLDLNETIISRMLQDDTPVLLSPVSMDEVFGASQSPDPSYPSSMSEQLNVSTDSDLGQLPIQVAESDETDSQDDPVLRRHKSEPGPNDNTRQSLKRITIHFPESVTVLYNRRTWPVNDIEVGVEASEDKPPSSGSSPQAAAKLMTLLPTFQELFQPALQCIHDAIHSTIPLIKLQHLTKCLREINQRVSDFNRDYFRSTVGACSDDLIDMLVIILCNCDAEDASHLYTHLMLLTDLMPPFFEGGPYSFSLVQFTVAYQFIQDRLVLRRRELSNSC